MLFILSILLTIILIFISSIFLIRRKRNKQQTKAQTPITDSHKEELNNITSKNFYEDIQTVANIENLFFGSLEANELIEFQQMFKQHKLPIDDDYIFQLIAHASFVNLKNMNELESYSLKLSLKPKDHFSTADDIKYWSSPQYISFAFFTINLANSYDNSVLFNLIYDPESIESFLVNDDIDQIIAHSLVTNFGNPHAYCTTTNEFASYVDFSAFSGSINCFRFFLANSYLINQKTCSFAIEGGNKEIIELLSQQGFTFNYMLKESLIYHRNEIAKWLIENYHCENIDFLFLLSVWNTEMILYFMNEKSNLSFVHPFDETSQTMQEIFNIGRVDVFQLILSKHPQDIHLNNILLDSKSHISTIENDRFLFYKLLFYKPDIFCGDEQYIAFEKDAARIYSFLIQKEGTNEKGYRQLFRRALEMGKFHIAQEMINQKLVFTTLSEKIAEIAEQIRLQKPKAVEFLFDQGVDVNSKDISGTPLFMRAVETNNPQIVEIFVKKKASLTLKNRKSQTVISKLKQPKYQSLYLFVKTNNYF